MNLTEYIIIQNRLKSNVFSKIEFKNNMAPHPEAQSPETTVATLPNRPPATEFAIFLSQKIAY